MVAKPPLPDDCSLPETVGAWMHAPDSNKNAHVWRGDDGRVSCGVFSAVGRPEMRVKVSDDRVTGFARSKDVATAGYDDPEAGHIEGNEQAAARAVEKAVAWMERHRPEDWSHPRVPESIFDAPAGYTLDRAYIEERDTTIYYRREDVDADAYGWRRGEDPDLDPEEMRPEAAPYLYIHVWAGSGNATVALAPFLGAHGPGSDHWEVVPVLDTPEDCGLEVALKLARDWAREYTDPADAPERDRPPVGQSDLSNWGETA